MGKSVLHPGRHPTVDSPKMFSIGVVEVKYSGKISTWRWHQISHLIFVNTSCNFSPLKGEIEFSFLLALYENIPTNRYSMLPFENVLPDRWQRLPSPFSELSAFKAGENEVGPRLHLPVHREAITAFRGHLLIVAGTTALLCDQVRSC